MATLKEVYDAFKADGAPLPDTYEAFESYMNSGPDNGVEHRKQWYDAFKADGAPLPDTYEEFSAALFPAGAAKPGADGLSGDVVRDGVVSAGATAGVNALAGVSKPGVTGSVGTVAFDPAEGFAVGSDGVSPLSDGGDGVAAAGDPNGLASRLRTSLLLDEALRGSEKRMKETLAKAERVVNGGSEQAKASAFVNRALADRAGVTSRLRGVPFQLSGSKGDGDGESGGDVALHTVEPVVHRVYQDGDGVTHTEWRLSDGSVSESLYEANADANLASVGRMQSHARQERSYRMLKRGLDPNNKDDLETFTALTATEEALREEERRKKELDKRYSERAEEIRKLAREQTGDGFLGIGSYNYMIGPLMESDTTLNELRLAMSQSDERRGKLERLRDEANGEDVGFWRGFGETFADPNTWILTPSLRNAVTGLSLKKKLERGEALTESEQMALDAVAANNATGDVDNIWHTSGVVAGYMPKFMADIALLGGADAASFAFTRNLTTSMLRGLPKAVSNRMTRFTVKALGATPEMLLRGAAVANTVQLPSTAADVINRHVGDLERDADGVYKYDDAKSWAEALYQAEGNAVIENASEMSGRFIDPVVKGIGKRLFSPKVVTRVLAVADKAGLREVRTATNRFMQHLGVNGVFGEIGEEFGGQIARTIARLDDANNSEGRNNLLDGKWYWDTCVSMALSMPLMGVLPGGFNATRYARLRHGVKKADRRGAELWGDRWAEFTARVDETDNASMSDLLLDVFRDANASKEQKVAKAQYVEETLGLRGFNLAEMADARGERADKAEADEEWDYLYGLDAPREEHMVIESRARDAALDFLDAMGLYDDEVASLGTDELIKRANEELHKGLGNAPFTSMSEAEALIDKHFQVRSAARAAHNHLEQSERLRGARDAREFEVAEVVESQHAFIDKRTDDDGFLVAASLKNDDAVFIRSGVVAVGPDGSIDKDASDADIIVVDADGATRMVSIDDVLGVGVPVEAAAEKARMEAETRKRMAAEYRPAEVKVRAGGGPKGYAFAKDDRFTVVDDSGRTIYGVVTHEASVSNDNTVWVDYYKDASRSGTPFRSDALTAEELSGKIDTYEGVDQETRAAEAAEPEQKAAEAAGQEQKAAEGAVPEASATTDAEAAPSVENGQQSALSRIPLNEQGKPNFEATDPDTAWDAIVEKTANEELAQSFADNMVANAEAALKKAEKAKTKASTDIDEFMAAENERLAAIDRAKAALEHWKMIAGTKERRAAAPVEGVATSEVVDEERLEREAAEAGEASAVEGAGGGQSADAVRSRAESEQPAAGADEELTPEEQALATRVEVTDNDWAEGEDDKPTYKREIIIDGTHKVTQVDAPDVEGRYTGSFFEFDGKRFGDIAEVAQYIDGHASAELKVDGGMKSEPTEAQKAAGNYKMEHRRIDGYNISIENPKGSVRRGTSKDAEGKETPWETTMQNDYGYIRGTEGVDGDHIDVFLSDTPEQGDVFVIDQVNKDGSFDEHKVMYGFPSEEAAREAYLSNYEQGWTGLGAITHVSKEEFKKWIGSSKRKTKPFAEYKSVKGLSTAKAAEPRQKTGSEARGKGSAGNSGQGGEVTTEPNSVNIANALFDERGSLIDVVGLTELGLSAERQSKLRAIAAKRTKGWEFDSTGRTSSIRIGGQDGFELTQDEMRELARLNAMYEAGMISRRELNNAHAALGSRVAERIAGEILNNNSQSDLPKYDRTVPTTPEAQRSAISRVIDFATRVKNRVERAVIGGITPRQAKDFAEHGIDVDETWVHSFESSAVTHNQKHHGNANVESTRGQIAISPEDYNRIPDILEQYDRVSKSPNKTKGTENEVIIYEKEFEDGYVYYLEEKRDSRKSLAFHTMYKKKKGTDSSDGFAANKTAPITPSATPDNLSSISDGKVNTFSANNQINKEQSDFVDKSADKQTGGAESSDVENRLLEFAKAYKDVDAKGMPAFERKLSAWFSEQTAASLVDVNSEMLGRICTAAGLDKGKAWAFRMSIDKSVPKDIIPRVFELRDERRQGISADKSAGPEQKGAVSKQFSIGNDVVSNQEVYEATKGLVAATGLPVVEVSDAEASAMLSGGTLKALRTSGGTVYGWTVGGKVYLNRDAMNPETPLHEYTHLWDEMVRKENPELWERGKELLRETPLWDEVVNDPNYADIAGDEDAVASEVHSRLTGKDGAVRLQEMIEAARGDGAMATAEAVTLVERIKGWLRDMFKCLKGSFEKWSKGDLKGLTVEDFTNLTLRDLASGVNPRVEMLRGDQLRTVTEANPMLDDYHTGIRKREDVLTFDEMLEEAEAGFAEYGDLAYPDMDIEMLRDAKRSGKITIYSSNPIGPGVFVTPSRMNAEDYAGGGHVYSKVVAVDDVAWISDDQGQYAPPTEAIDNGMTRFHYSREKGAAKGGGREDFDAMRERAVSERGIVMPGLNEAEVRVVDVPRHDFGGKKPIAQARKWAKENIVGEHTLVDSEGREVPYTISSKSIDKYLSETAIGKSSNMGVHLAALKKLPEIISESIEAEIHPDYTKNDHASRSVENGINPDNLIHRFYGAALIDGQIHRVKTTIIENGIVQKNKPHSYEVTVVELINDAESQPDNHGRIGRPRFSEKQQMELLEAPSDGVIGNSGEPLAMTPNSSISAANLLKGVEKSYDDGKKLLDESERSGAEAPELGQNEASEAEANGAETEVRQRVGFVRQGVERFKERYRSRPVVVVSGLSDIEGEAVSAGVKDALRSAFARDVDGLYCNENKKIYIFADRISDEESLASTLFHENVHAVVDAMAEYPGASLDGFAEDVVSAFPAFGKALEAIRREYGADVASEEFAAFFLSGAVYNGRRFEGILSGLSAESRGLAASIIDNLIKTSNDNRQDTEDVRGAVQGDAGAQAGGQEGTAGAGAFAKISEGEREALRSRSDFMLAPNGERSQLSEEQWVTVRTEAFKRWFGDWESKGAVSSVMLDENGEPKVYFHGSPNEFYEFNIDYFGTTTDSGYQGVGFYFGNEKTARQYSAGREPMAVFLNLRNPLIVRDGTATTQYEEICAFAYGSKSVDELYERLDNLLNEGLEPEIVEVIREGVGKYITEEKLKEINGYDGVVRMTSLGRVTEVVATKPEQIKSAVLNDGGYRSDSKDIRHRQGDNYGAYSDAEMSYLNDPISQLTGKNRFGKKRQAAYAERMRRYMVSTVEDLVAKLNIDKGMVDIVTDLSELDAVHASAKGFYNKRTGKITVVIPNNLNTIDVKQTFLHEAVAHYGLRKLFGEHFNTFLDNVYESAEEGIRRKIAEMAARNGWNFRTATEEYLAGLAESTHYNGAPDWWETIKRLFLDMLESIGFEGFRDKVGVVLTDNELRYILWRSYKNLEQPGLYRSILGEAEDVAKQAELKVGNYAEHGIEAESAAEPSNVDELNERFNNELRQQIDGTLPEGHVYEMGMPSKYLRSTGIENLPIRLSAKILNLKSNLDRHTYSLEAVKNLVKALQKPWAIFAYGDKAKAQNLIIGIEDNGRQFLVGLSINPTVKGRSLEINSVRNVFPKNNHEWVNWINEGKLLRVDGKEEIQAVIDKLRMTPVAFDYLDLDNAAKVVKDFENPTIEPEDLFRPGDFTPRDKVLARDAYERVVASGSYQFKEAVQDSMLGLKELYEAISDGAEAPGQKQNFRIEDVAGFENAYLYENRMSSTNAGEQHEYFLRYMQQLLKEIGAIAGSSDAKRRDLTDYMMDMLSCRVANYFRVI